jgi:peptidoglycan hydrolase CwlO-like protein
MTRLARISIFAIFTAAMLVFSLAPTPAVTLAQGDDAAQQEEIDRLTYEILELKSRRKKAINERDVILEELEQLDASITSTDEEVGVLEGELEQRQEAYDKSLRDLYMRGDVSELEVLLGSSELEEMWRDIDYYERMMESGSEALEELKVKLDELEIKKRDLNEAREKRERLVESLDVTALDGRIAELESSLSQINDQLRTLRAGEKQPRSPAPDPPAWTVPSPGQLLDRVPTSPPLSDFERTGMTYSGYTTSYGADFHGRSTASGIIFNMYDYTCAHKTLPFGTWLLVTFQGRQVIVQVNDRGPFVPGRVLDLSYGSAQSIGLNGVQWTEFEILVPLGG